MRLCYECGKEIQDPKEMVLKEFRVAECGVRWIKPFHAQCWQRRQKVQKRKNARFYFGAVAILTCIAAAILLLTFF